MYTSNSLWIHYVYAQHWKKRRSFSGFQLFRENFIRRHTLAKLIVKVWQHHKTKQKLLLTIYFVWCLDANVSTVIGLSGIITVDTKVAIDSLRWLDEETQHHHHQHHWRHLRHVLHTDNEEIVDSTLRHRCATDNEYFRSSSLTVAVRREGGRRGRDPPATVSYTHLTLPTILRV